MENMIRTEKKNDDVKHLSCPFCGSTDVDSYELSHPSWRETYFCIDCHDCGETWSEIADWTEDVVLA